MIQQAKVHKGYTMLELVLFLVAGISISDEARAKLDAAIVEFEERMWSMPV